MSTLLVGLHHSPWTERARWALDHHGIAHMFEEYKPILGEVALRLKLRAFGGKVTVPVLFDGKLVVRDSLDIVRHADARGGGSPLVPADLERQILDWNARAEKALAAGRSLYVRALLQSPEALAENAPAAIPAPLRAPSARAGTALFRYKHGLDARSASDDEADVAAVFHAFRAALRGDYVLGRFTLADISMAVAIQHVAPVADRYIHLSPAARMCSTHAILAARYADLASWRDVLYTRHRRPAGAAARAPAGGVARP